MTEPVTTGRVTRLWLPLAMSWLMMGVELPLVSAIIAKMPNDTAHLSALSSIVYPLALLVEAPIIMLLAASTALARDAASYRKLWRFTHGAGLILTLIHVGIAFSPLYDWIAVTVIKTHPSVVEPGRVGLQLLTPWTWAIASRRFQQGVLIRFEHSAAVVRGTGVRLLSMVTVLTVGYHFGTLSGIAVGSLAIASGVVAEALYASWRVAPVRRAHLDGTTDASPLSWADFARFYAPLAVTPFMTIILQSVGAAAMNRMPEKMASTAAWSSVYGLVFLLRTAGFAFNEVVVTLVAAPQGVVCLRRFAWGMGLSMSGLLVILAWTPLGGFWFGSVIGLSTPLTSVATEALACAVLMPGYAVLQSYYQGALVRNRRTRAVTEAVTVYVVASGIALGIGISLHRFRGIEFALTAFTLAGILQTIWLWYRSRPVLAELAAAGSDQDSASSR